MTSLFFSVSATLPSALFKEVLNSAYFASLLNALPTCIFLQMVERFLVLRPYKQRIFTRIKSKSCFYEIIRAWCGYWSGKQHVTMYGNSRRESVRILWGWSIVIERFYLNVLRLGEGYCEWIPRITSHLFSRLLLPPLFLPASNSV